MAENDKEHEEDTDEQGVEEGEESPTEEEFFEVLDKVVKANPKKRQSPDEEN